MQRRGRTTGRYRVRLILLALLGLSLLLWLSLGILLIVHADSPQNSGENATLLEYKDVCIQCHRRVFTDDNNPSTRHSPGGLNFSDQKFPAVHLQTYSGGSALKPASWIP